MILSENKDFKDAGWEPLEKEHGFKLSSGEGEKIIYLQFRDKIGYISPIQQVTIFVDINSPYIINYEYPSPVQISNDFQVKIQFNESMDTTYIPVVNLLSTGEKNPIISGQGTFTTIKSPNDTYITPPIILDESMGGAITIVVSKAFDMAKNEMELKMDKSFNFDTYAPIAAQIKVKEGNYVRNPKINFTLSVIGAVKMMLSENQEFKDTTWIDYAGDIEYFLSNKDGIKKVYFKFEDENKNISKPKRVEITLDRVKPKITGFDLPETIEINKPFKITIHYSEEIRAEKPAIVLMSTNRINYLIFNEGTFISDKNKNDTYVTPEIVFDESMKGAIVIVVDQIFDPTGNKMDIFNKLLFYFGVEDPNKQKIKISEGKYTTKEDITILFNYADIKKMKISEDPEQKFAKWLGYKNRIRYTLSKNEGEKNIYITVIHNDEKIEKSNFKIILDKTEPKLIKSVFPEEDNLISNQIKFIFSEQLNINFQPVIIITDANGKNILLSEKGRFTNTKEKNDTFITPVIPKYNKLAYPIDISITKAYDAAGNVMKLVHVKKER
ncbi:hypothetical protein HY745_14430 [Candidatus Desantisbacteria bacterium]|nr:hypothetical protein [Candidatus Desantisbacteria bacterium]